MRTCFGWPTAGGPHRSSTLPQSSPWPTCSKTGRGRVRISLRRPAWTRRSCGGSYGWTGLTELGAAVLPRGGVQRRARTPPGGTQVGWIAALTRDGAPRPGRGRGSRARAPVLPGVGPRQRRRVDRGAALPCWGRRRVDLACAGLAARHACADLEPFRETGWQRLMRALADAGNRAEALRAYVECRALMARELGVASALKQRGASRPGASLGGSRLAASDTPHGTRR